MRPVNKLYSKFSGKTRNINNMYKNNIICYKISKNNLITIKVTKFCLESIGNFGKSITQDIFFPTCIIFLRCLYQQYWQILYFSILKNTNFKTSNYRVNTDAITFIEFKHKNNMICSNIISIPCATNVK